MCSDACDGTINHHGRGGQQFLYKGMNQSAINAHNITIPLFEPAPGDMVLDPSTVHTLHPAAGCKNRNGKKPTICKASLRTVNSQAVCGSAEDVYYWAPWRAPGSAPVIDACGSAGGRHRRAPGGHTFPSLRCAPSLCPSLPRHRMHGNTTGQFRHPGGSKRCG